MIDELVTIPARVRRTLRDAQQRRGVSQRLAHFLGMVEHPVEIAQYQKRNTLGLPNGRPCSQRRDLPGEQQAWRPRAARNVVALTAGFQMHDQHTEMASVGKPQRCIQPVAQPMAGLRFDIEGSVVGIARDSNGAAHGKPHTLHDGLPDRDDAVALRIKDRGGRLRSIDLFKGHNIGIQVIGIVPEQREIFRCAHVNVRGKIGFRSGANRQPFHVPRADLDRVGVGGCDRQAI